MKFFLKKILPRLRLQQYIVPIGKQLTSLTHAIKNCPLINSNKGSQALERGSMGRKIIDNSMCHWCSERKKWLNSHRKTWLSNYPRQQPPPNSVNLANNFPAHIFETGNSNNTTEAEDQLRILSLAGCIKEDCSNLSCSTNSSNYENNWEETKLREDLISCTDNQNSNKESCLFTQRWRVSHMGEDLVNKTQVPSFFLASSRPSAVLIQTFSSPEPPISQKSP